MWLNTTIESQQSEPSRYSHVEITLGTLSIDPAGYSNLKLSLFIETCIG